MRAFLKTNQGLCAFLFYLFLSIIYFGVPILRNPSYYHIGSSGGDPGVYMWLFRWWPYALFHLLNIFITRIAFHPSGFNLMWGVSMPGPAFLASPLTYLFGPVVAYNVVCLLAPPLAAWGAFLACRQASRSLWPSLLGGFLFGFSPYMLGQMTSHLPLCLVFPVPLAVYVFLRWMDREISDGPFTALLAILFAAQFLCSTEILATATIFGAMALVVAVLFESDPIRKRLIRGALLTGVALCISAILLTPFLYYAVAFGVPRGPSTRPKDIRLIF